MREPSIPPCLVPGDQVRFVSPSSPVDRAVVEAQASIVQSWGFVVEFGRHVFDRHGFLAGTDEARLMDLNEAPADRPVRAVIATRGGKGSYRIADGLDVNSIRSDPKFLVGFSDNTALHLMAARACNLVTLHRALYGRPYSVLLKRQWRRCTSA